MFAVRSPKLELGNVLAFGLCARLAWLVLCPNVPTSDQFIYQHSAEMLAAGAGYIDQSGRPANYWPVGYAALLAPFYASFGAHPLIAYLVNLLCSLATVFFAARLGSELFGARAGLIAALFVAVHPTFVLHTTILASEVPFMTGMLALSWLLVRAVRMNTFTGSRAALWGVGIGVLVYIRPTAQLLLLLPVLLGLCFRRMEARRLLAGTALAALCAFFVLLPWGVRNYERFGVFALTSMNAGSNFWMGNNPESRGTYMPLPEDTAKLTFFERDRVLGKRALAFVRGEPLRYIELCVERVLGTLKTDTIAVVWNEPGILQTFGARGVGFFKWWCTLAHWSLLSAVALALARKRAQLGRADLAMASMVLLVCLPFVLVVGGNRYMIPVLPLLCVWAASLVRVPSTQRVFDESAAREAAHV